MDLRINHVTARCAGTFLFICLGAILLLWSFPVSANSLASERDYLLPADVNGGYAASSSHTQSSSSSSKQSKTSNYRSFDGSTYNLAEHTGHYVRLLLPNEALFTPDHIEELVDQLDMHYALYTELMHAEPSGSGLLSVAFLPQTCNFGCGLLGAKGIEILSDPLNYQNIIRELDSGRLESILVHEMAHNFDRYARYLHYLPDHAHAWTDMFEYFAPYRYARSSRNNEAPDDAYNSPVRAVWKDYVTDEAANWETCVMEQSCLQSGLTPNHLWAMLYYRIESLHGVDAVLGSFKFLADYTAKYPAPPTSEEKEGLRILSLAVGAGTNISCYMDSLKWPVAASVRAEMQKRFGGAGPKCRDADGDGFSAVTGDCDDSNDARNILAHEIAGNGLDDDCDDLVDETLLGEVKSDQHPNNYVNVVQAYLPFEVDGNLSEIQDYNTFQFPLGETNRVRITLCSDGEFKGWVAALQSEGVALEAPVWNIYQANAGCTNTTFDYGDLSSGMVLVMADESQGEYSLTVSEAASLLPDHSVYLRVEQSLSGGIILQADDRDGLLAGLGADELEFWISGIGLQIFRPFSSQAGIFLGSVSVPGLEPGTKYQVRMRPRRNGIPLAGFSDGHLFRYQPGPTTLPQLDSTYSGAWFDPGHDGEGFIVEVLENDRALVYWFTYDSHGNQRWMLGLGSIAANRIEIGELLEASGGRFGDNFDPADVLLKSVGSLSIDFEGCSEAIANFSINNTGGHLELSRLTEIAGHDCETGASPAALDLSGSWYDPGHDGEGFIVQQLSASQALVVWFTYDANGNASWLLSNGVVNGSEISLQELVQPVGGTFGRSFDPQAIAASAWGELSLDLDCQGGKATYTPSAPGFSSGSQQLVNLTRLKNSGCRSDFNRD